MIFQNEIGNGIAEIVLSKHHIACDTPPTPVEDLQALTCKCGTIGTSGAELLRVAVKGTAKLIHLCTFLGFPRQLVEAGSPTATQLLQVHIESNQEWLK